MVVIGSTLFSGSLDGTIRRWSLKEKDLTSLPKDKANSHASNQEPATESASYAPAQEKHEEKKPGMMTEEEERELAELMDGDDDD